MKINFSSLFKQQIHKYKFFFIYGNDLSTFNRIISFLNKSFSSAIEIQSEKDLIANTAIQVSLFEETHKSLTLVSNVSDKILSHIENLGEGTFIFTSEKARSQSKLVTFFSASPHSLSIAAYAAPLTPSEFGYLTEDLKLPAPFKGMLFTAYQNDYMGLLAAIEKIKLYGEVPESAYAAFLESSSTFDEFQPLIHSFLLRNKKLASRILFTLNISEIISFLRSLLRYFQILYEILPFKDKPECINWQKLSSPIFFKDQPIYQTALSQWQYHQLQPFMESLLDLEYKIKYGKATLSQINQELLNKGFA